MQVIIIAFTEVVLASPTKLGEYFFFYKLPTKYVIYSMEHIRPPYYAQQRKYAISIFLFKLFFFQPAAHS